MSSFNEGDTRLLKTYKPVALKKNTYISIQKLNHLYIGLRIKFKWVIPKILKYHKYSKKSYI